MNEVEHAGIIFKREFLDGVLLREAAAQSGVKEPVISRLARGLSPITPLVAVRFQNAGWSTAERWLALQAAYDIELVRKSQ